MTKAEALAACEELSKLIPAGPAVDPVRAARAKALVDGLRRIPDLGLIARQIISAIESKSQVHFNSTEGFRTMTPALQRSRLAGDIGLLCMRLEEELTDGNDYGPPRP